MRNRKWLRIFSTERDAATALAAFSRSAAAGDSLERLLELAAEDLFKLAQADRVGVWLATQTPQVLDGVALDIHAKPAPTEWRYLDVAAFPWSNVQRGSTPLIADFPEKPSAPNAKTISTPPVLAEMNSAVWWPVRSAGRTVGVALLAFRKKHVGIAEAASPFVWALLNQLALAYQAQHAREALASSSRKAAMQKVTVPAAEQQATAQLHALIEAVESGVLLLDAMGRVQLLNEQFIRLFGLEERAAARLSGGSTEELLAVVAPLVRDPETFSRRWRELSLLGDSTAWEEVELVNPAGRVVQRFSRPVSDAQGRRLGWLELYRERSEQVAGHMPMLQTEKMAAIGQLVSGIAHELNNPLTSIMGYAQLLLAHIPGRSGANERRRETESIRGMAREAHKIYLEAERAGRIVNNLLLFARSGRGDRRAVDLNEIVERTLALRSYELKIENIHFETQLDADLSPTLADPHQLQQVVLNLLVNAEQAILESPAGERAESAAGGELGRIRIRTYSLPDSQPPRVALEVSDSGPGVPPQHVSRLFDPFFTTKPIGLGTGLGLSIAYGIVHDHGGEIYLSDARMTPRMKPLGGATFVVELPVLSAAETTAHDGGELARAEGPEPPTLRADERVASGEASRRGGILVVEDEPTVAQLIADVLKEEGYRVDVVLDSREGLARVERFGYELIVCDLRMPRIDGRAFYRSLVRSGHPAQLRLLFVTGDRLSPRTQDFLAHTGLPCLAKPFLVEELKSIVASTLASLRKQSNGSSRDRKATNPTSAEESAAHPDAPLPSLEQGAEEVREQ